MKKMKVLLYIYFTLIKELFLIILANDILTAY